MWQEVRQFQGHQREIEVEATRRVVGIGVALRLPDDVLEKELLDSAAMEVPYIEIAVLLSALAYVLA